MKQLFLCLLTFLCPLISFAQNRILEQLKQIPEISDITETNVDDFETYYQFYFKQPVDHNTPNGESFYQRVEIGFRSINAPTVVNLEGYSLRKPAACELSKKLKGNQITIEHRYFGESIPHVNLNWSFLTIKQAATDQHQIIQKLKTVLTDDRWLSTGISKGGQGVVFHRYFYPNDVKAGVAYVAPINNTLIDPRIEKHINKLGDHKKLKAFLSGFENVELDTKWNILDFQMLCFKREAELLPLYEIYAHQNNLTFNIVGGIERAFELTILEYQFSFWQWGHVNDEIPEADAKKEDIIAHLMNVSSPSFFSDTDIRYYQPYFYSALTETGFYEYSIKSFKKFFEDKENIRFDFAFPPHAERPAFNQGQLDAIHAWLQTDAQKLLFIYGGNDPWFATAADLGDNMKCYKFVSPDKDHKCRIASFEGATQMTINEIIRDWIKE